MDKREIGEEHERKVYKKIKGVRMKVGVSSARVSYGETNYKWRI